MIWGSECDPFDHSISVSLFTPLARIIDNSIKEMWHLIRQHCYNDRDMTRGDNHPSSCELSKHEDNPEERGEASQTVPRLIP